MARCMLCSSPVGEADVVCPRCGGAVEDGPEDVTRVGGPAAGGYPGGPAPTGPAPVDLGKSTGPPTAESTWPGDAGGPLPAGPPSDWGTGPYPGFAYGPPQPGFGAPPTAYGYGPHSAYGPGFPPGWVPPPPPMPQEGMALAAFLTSLIGVVTATMCLVPILACPVGAVLGHVALRRIEQTGKQGRGFALAGVIIGWVGTAILVIGTAAIVAIAIASGSSG